MPVPRAWIWLIVSALLALLPASNLRAQEAAAEAPVPIPTLDIQRFTPVGSYHNFLTVHDGQLLPKKKFGFDVVFNYAYRPLQTVARDLRRTGGAVDGLFAGHFRAGFAFTDWVELDLGIGFMQIASTGEGILELGGKQQVFSLGDLWIEGRFRVLREIDSSTSFRQVEAEMIEDPAGQFLSSVERAGFEFEARRFADMQGYSVDWDSVAQLDDETLINGVAQIAPFDPASKQALLEAPDLKQRCELMIQLMQFFALRDDGDEIVTLQ